MKYFTINELTRSVTAATKGINNAPGVAVKANLEALVDNVLDPLRSSWGHPIIVSSGYRCPELNKAIGGAVNSQHIKGQAADITTLSDSRDDNMRLLRLLLRSGIEFDQVIAEDIDAQGRPNWIHVSFNRAGNRRKLTTYINGKYINGIKL